MTEHVGTRTCYAHGCRCEAGRAAHLAYETQRRRRIVEGIPRLVDPEPYAALLRKLTLPAMTLEQMETLTGVSAKTLKEIRSGYRGAIRKDTADAIDAWIESLPSESDVA